MKLLTGHVLEVLPTLPERSVQTICTSPPYWGLRKYSGEQEVVWSDGWKGALGLEPTPALYIEHSMMVLDALWRVLRDDGVLWWNLGDSYAGGGGASGHTPETENCGRKTVGYGAVATGGRVPNGLKPKDLCLIPFRFAIAAQERGWWVRSDIIWSKPNPMPESVTDRPTRSHEYIFMLTKAARYFYDAEAVKERYAEGTFKRLEQPSFWEQEGGPKDGINPNRSCRRAVENLKKNMTQNGGRNLRSVWTITTHPYPEAHFATFPPELPRRCILASTSPKACPSCGAPWVRVVERTPMEVLDGPKSEAIREQNRTATSGTMVRPPHSKTLGWKPTCSCPSNDGSGRCIVLDPFCGSGTTVQVAEELNREGWGIDISKEYQVLQGKRIAPWQGQRRLI